MKVISIKANKESIIFEINESIMNEEVVIKEYFPLKLGQAGYIDREEIRNVGENLLIIPRFSQHHDRIYSQFILETNNNNIPGDCYVTDLEEVGIWNYPYPQPDTIKAIAADGEDIRILGAKQSLVNINLPALMSVEPKEEIISYECEGKKYYFIRDEVLKLDEYMINTYQYGAVVTGILLNAPHLFDSRKESKLLGKVIHPDYDWDSDSTYISAFNMRTEEGQEYYKAFVGFLVERYAREDAKYGRMCGFIISNEVDSQYIWGNAGEKSVSEYTYEYTATLRLAWISSRKYYSNFRIYVSLDHFWNLSFHTNYEKRYYKGKDIIDWINQYSKEEGDFDWNVAYHPYPENLMYPDFYNDRSAEFNYSTPRITFKNIEMLPAYLSQTKMLYKNKPRRIILSEQGFNSKGDSFSEKQGAAAYCLAYQKVKKIDTIDLFTHHAYVDNPYEFGLNLGIRRRNEDGTIGEPKPIYYVMRDMNTDKEPQRIKEAREFIGAELFDSLLNPDIIYGEADREKESEFQTSNTKE